jgi:hypothetical protein
MPDNLGPTISTHYLPVSCHADNFRHSLLGDGKLFYLDVVGFVLDITLCRVDVLEEYTYVDFFAGVVTLRLLWSGPIESLPSRTNRILQQGS